MGNGMNKVLPGLYIGNYRDSKDAQQLERHKITHILAIHDSPRRLLPDKHYLCVMASDTPDQNLSQYFNVCNDFIHAARIRDGHVLIHCLAGMSRSVTVAVAYIMSVTSLNWKESLKVVRAGRAVANPNLGFQNQLQEFEALKLGDERRRLKERFPSTVLAQSDREQCALALTNYRELLSNRDICEGDCVRGQECPTGLCVAEGKLGIFRSRKVSVSSTRSHLAARTTSSCPASPRKVLRPQEQIDENYDTVSCSSSTSVTYRTENKTKRNDSLRRKSSNTNLNGLQHSASSSKIRARSSPAGLFSYTGASAPPSVRSSRVDLSTAGTSKGSAIYLGCNPPKSDRFGSTLSIKSNSSSKSVTPSVSPRNIPKK